LVFIKGYGSSIAVNYMPRKIKFTEVGMELFKLNYRHTLFTPYMILNSLAKIIAK